MFVDQSPLRRGTATPRLPGLARVSGLAGLGAPVGGSGGGLAAASDATAATLAEALLAPSSWVLFHTFQGTPSPSCACPLEPRRLQRSVLKLYCSSRSGVSVLSASASSPWSSRNVSTFCLFFSWRLAKGGSTSSLETTSQLSVSGKSSSELRRDRAKCPFSSLRRGTVTWSLLR